MAKFDFNFDEDFTRQLERLADYDNIAPKILEGGVYVLNKYVSNEVSKHQDTGDLYNSLKIRKPSKNKYGWYASVIPTGSDKKGSRNMEKLAHLEYGYIDKSGKQVVAKPILTKAINNAEVEVLEKMQELFNEVMDEYK